LNYEKSRILFELNADSLAERKTKLFNPFSKKKLIGTTFYLKVKPF